MLTLVRYLEPSDNCNSKQWRECSFRFYVSGVSGTSAVAFSGAYSSDSGVFVDLPVTGQMELEANGANSGVVNISQAGVTITPNSSNTKSTHRFVVSVARGERPFVDGVIY